jgi:hypothetical protein
MKQSLTGTSTANRGLQRAHRKVPIVDGAQRPGDDEPRMQIENRREEEPTTTIADEQLRRVPDPALVRKCGLEAPLEQIRRHRLIMLAHRRRAVTSTNSGLKAFLLHQPNDPVAANVLAALGQLDVDARAAVGATAALVRFAHDDGEAPVLA